MLWLFFLPFVWADEEVLDAPVDSGARWSVLVPAFVMHGIQPTGGAQNVMPRKLDPSGRFVGTPGVGVEWEGSESLDIIAAFLKDCYDDFAGTIQAGQYFRLGESTRIGYTLGLYIRQTPITCYSTTQTTTTTVNQSAPPLIGGGGGNTGNVGNNGGQPSTTVSAGQQPTTTNRLSTTTCLFDDNLPIRYTFKMGGGYVDVIPSPFLNFGTRLYNGSFQIFFKFLTNFYLNEFGLAVAF